MSSPLLILRKVISLVLILALVTSPEFSYAQSAFVSTLPEPGKMVSVSPAFTPILVKGLVIHPDKPLNFDFIVDSGNDSTDQSVVKEQSERMARYFLAAITVPENQLWVNLSPYEKDRVIENELGQTVLGRDMLAQDYILKQVTSSVIYPEKGLGKEFWNRVYAEAQSKFGTTDIPVDSFNKVWIMPEKAEVFENGNAVYVTEAKLKVMLDSDRTATQNASVSVTDEKAAVAKAMLRDIVLPAIEKEVNEGKNFGVIRQIYYTAILAKWYRELIQNTLLADAYVGKNKIAGVTSDEKALKEEIYQRYIAAYKKGVFDYIKEEPNVVTGEVVPRKYFAGGETLYIEKLAHTGTVTKASRSTGKIFKVDLIMGSAKNVANNNDAAMIADLALISFWRTRGNVDKITAMLFNGDDRVRQAAMKAIDKLVTDPEKKVSIFETAWSHRWFHSSDIDLWAMQEIDRLVTDPQKKLPILVNALGERGQVPEWAMKEIDRLITDPQKKLPVLVNALEGRDQVPEWAKKEIYRLITDPQKKLSVLVNGLAVRGRAPYRILREIDQLAISPEQKIEVYIKTSGNQYVWGVRKWAIDNLRRLGQSPRIIEAILKYQIEMEPWKKFVDRRLKLRQPSGAMMLLSDLQERAYQYAREGYDFDVVYVPKKSETYLTGRKIQNPSVYDIYSEVDEEEEKVIQEEKLSITRGKKLSDEEVRIIRGELVFDESMLQVATGLKDAGKSDSAMSALSENSDPAMTNEVMQWFVSHQQVLVIGAVLGIPMAIKFAREWLLNNSRSSLKKMGQLTGINWLCLLAIRSKNPKNRITAIQYFRHQHNRKAIPFIAKQLTEGDHVLSGYAERGVYVNYPSEDYIEVRRLSRKALVELGADKEMVFRVNVEALKASGGGVAGEALEFFAHEGDARAIKPIQEFIRNNVFIRNANYVLSKLGVDQEVIFQDTLKALKVVSGSAYGVSNIIQYLMELGDSRAIDPIVDIVKRNPSIAHEIYRQLPKEGINKGMAVRVVLGIMEVQDNDPGKLEEAGDFLISLNYPDAIPELIRMWEEGKASRHVLSRVLHKFGWMPTALNKRIAFYAAVKDWNELVRIGASATSVLAEAGKWDEIIEIGDPAVPELVKIWETDKDPQSLLQATLYRFGWSPEKFIEKIQFFADLNKWDSLAGLMTEARNDQGDLKKFYALAPLIKAVQESGFQYGASRVAQAISFILNNEEFDIAVTPAAGHYEIRRIDGDRDGALPSEYDEWVVDNEFDIGLVSREKGSNKTKDNSVGGIDIKDIGIVKTGSGRIAFNEETLRQVFNAGFNGLTPVFIKMTQVDNPLAVLGVN